MLTANVTVLNSITIFCSKLDLHSNTNFWQVKVKEGNVAWNETAKLESKTKTNFKEW